MTEAKPGCRMSVAGRSVSKAGATTGKAHGRAGVMHPFYLGFTQANTFAVIKLCDILTWGSRI